MFWVSHMNISKQYSCACLGSDKADHNRRYDAPQYIKLQTKNIANYAQFPKVLEEFNSKYGLSYTEAEVLDDLEMVLRMDEMLEAAKIPLAGIVPYKAPNAPAGNGFEIVDHETDGEHKRGSR